MEEILTNKNLSWKAKGLMAFFLSSPDRVDLNLLDLSEYSKDGRDSLRAGLKELEDAGYIGSGQIRENGKIVGFGRQLRGDL